MKPKRILRGKAPLALLLLMACGATPPEADPRPAGEPRSIRVAALPFRNLTPYPEAKLLLMDGILAHLQLQGAEFVPVGDLEDILRARRIRYTDSMSADAARALGESTGAQLILLGTILEFDPDPPLQISLAIRVLDASTGHRLRSSLSSLTGAEFEGLLGLGIITDPDELAAESIARVIEDLRFAELLDMPRAPDELAALSSPSGLLHDYRWEGFDPADIDRIALLPLENRTNEPGISDLISASLADQWFRLTGIKVIEQAEMIAAMVRAKVRMIERLDLEALSMVAKELQTRYVAIGSIDRYRREVWTGNEYVPEIEISLQIFDVEKSKVAAAVAINRRGDDYHVVLGLGTIRNPSSLANQIIVELVEALGS